MNSPATRYILTFFLCFLLASCLPGKKKEERVIAEAVMASQTVQAEKAAADMSNAAQSLLSSKDIKVTNSNELQTMRCADGRVIAFVPKSSKLAKQGELSHVLAQRIRLQLQAQFPPSAVVDAKEVTGCAAAGGSTGSIEIAAINAPVLILEDTSASMTEVAEDESTVVSVDMKTCGENAGKRIPGVIITKTFKDGSQKTESQCGSAAPADDALADIELTEGSMANWKAQLTGTNPTGEVNFVCIAGTSGCTPIKPNSGTKVICPDKPDKKSLMANPVFDRSTYEFVPEAASRDCGKGWTGELVARVKKRTCQVVRNGEAQEEPASVYEVAYVGAKCRKGNVITQESCPAGPEYLDGGHVQKRETLIMNQPIALSPYAKNEKKQNISKIGYRTPQGETNINDELSEVITRANPISKAHGTESEQMFAANSDLSAVSSSQFDQKYVTELRAMNKLTGGGDLTCFAKGQDCSIGKTPGNIEVIVDRTAPMAAGISDPVFDANTACQATMANLFAPGNRGAACSAVTAWQTLATAQGLQAKVINAWNYAIDPTTQANSLLTTFKNALSADTKKQLNDLEATMVSSLSMLDYSEKLRYGLAVGQDCNPPLMANGKLKVQEDMYGTCMPYNPTPKDITNGVFANGKTYRNFQTSCPGVCVTKLASSTPISTRIGAVDSYVSGALVPRLPGKAKVNYSEVKSGVGGTPPVVLVNGSSDENSAYVTQAALKVLEPFQGTPATGPVTPVFQSIDEAIDRLRKQTLDADRNAKATILVFGSKYDTNCVKKDGWLEGAIIGTLLGGSSGGFIGRAIDNANGGCKQWYESPYFGRNICNPERVPSGYDCKYCRNSFRKWNPFTGEYICTEPGFARESKRIDMNKLRDTGKDGKLSGSYKIDSLRSREKWCRDNEFKKGCGPFGICLLDYRFMKVEPVYQGNAYDNENSLAGFLGRTYPGVIVYYFDLEGGGIGTMCKADENHDPQKEHAFYQNIQKIWSFDVKTDIAGKLGEALKKATGGGKPDDSVGKEICQKVFGANVNVDYGIPPVPLPPREGSFESEIVAKGEGLIGYSGSAAVTLTKPLVSSVTMLTTPVTSSTCIDGVRPFTLKSCQ